jgi:hypothetical protein
MSLAKKHFYSPAPRYALTYRTRRRQLAGDSRPTSASGSGRRCLGLTTLHPRCNFSDMLQYLFDGPVSRGPCWPFTPRAIQPYVASPPEPFVPPTNGSPDKLQDRFSFQRSVQSHSPIRLQRQRMALLLKDHVPHQDESFSITCFK